MFVIAFKYKNKSAWQIHPEPFPSRNAGEKQLKEWKLNGYMGKPIGKGCVNYIDTGAAD